MVALARGSRITGTQRAELAAQLGQRYAAGESLRAIAEDTGRSFGFVHGLVKESGVDLRGRGGATRGPAARSAAAARAGRATSAGEADGGRTSTAQPAGSPLDPRGPAVDPVTPGAGSPGKASRKAGPKAEQRKPGKKGEKQKAGKKEAGAKAATKEEKAGKKKAGKRSGGGAGKRAAAKGER